MANKGKKNNKLKRKRGKKFKYVDGAIPQGVDKKSTANPFESHSASRKATKDKLKRTDLVDEYKNRGKNNVFIDKRIGETSSKISEDEKMRLRYLREQRDRLKQRTTKHSNRKAKFNLDDGIFLDEEQNNDMFMGFTHKGKKLEEIDDFKDEIPLSDYEEADPDDRDAQMGRLNEQMVQNMNFGGGEFEGNKKSKSRKEVFEEIIAKSKAYKAVKGEIKVANEELREQLDNEFQDLLPLLNMNKYERAKGHGASLDKESKIDKSYEQIAYSLKESERALPSQVVLGDREQARSKKEKLERLEQEQLESQPVRKRELKDLNKREQAIERVQKHAMEKYKNDIKVSIIEDRMREAMKKAKKKDVEIDSDLASEVEDDEYDSEDDEEYASEQDGESQEEQQDDDQEDDDSDQNSDEQEDSDDQDSDSS